MKNKKTEKNSQFLLILFFFVSQAFFAIAIFPDRGWSAHSRDPFIINQNQQDRNLIQFNIFERLKSRMIPWYEQKIWKFRIQIPFTVSLFQCNLYQSLIYKSTCIDSCVKWKNRNKNVYILINLYVYLITY